MTEQIRITHGTAPMSAAPLSHGFQFAVILIDAAGYEHPIWAGSSYELAIRNAKRMQARVVPDAPLRDMVGAIQ